MATINEALTVMINRVIDSVYLVCTKNKIGYKNFCKIIDDLEDRAFTDLYKNYGTRPYIKKQFLNSTLSDVNPEQDLKEHISSLSLSIRDILIMIEGKRENVNKIKNFNVLKTPFLDNYKSVLNNLTSSLLAYNDMLLELEQCSDESEMNKNLEEFLGKAD